jgi:uncharacterized membrane protein YeaQ/YmgE (transglycosylase-associated protein family)
MTLLGFVVLLVIAAIAGAIGQAISGYSFGGCLVSVIVGWIGAYIGMWIANQFGLPEPFMIQVQGQAFPLLWSVIGSAVLTTILGLIFRSRRVY